MKKIMIILLAFTICLGTGVRANSYGVDDSRQSVKAYCCPELSANTLKTILVKTEMNHMHPAEITAAMNQTVYWQGLKLRLKEFRCAKLLMGHKSGMNSPPNCRKITENTYSVIASTTARIQG